MTLDRCFKTAVAGLLLSLLSGCMSPEGATVDSKRDSARQMRSG